MPRIELDVEKKYFFKYVVLDNFLSDKDLEYFNTKNKINTLPFNHASVISSLRIFKDNKIQLPGGEDLIPRERIMAIHKKYVRILSDSTPR